VRFLDILGLALSSLWQQKARTALTTLGVLFGSFVLAASLSIGQGVQETIAREAGRHDYLRRIDVRTKWRSNEADRAQEEVQIHGEMSDPKRQRIREALIDFKAQFSPARTKVALTRDKLRGLADLDHVEAVVPRLWLHTFVSLEHEPQGASVAGAMLDDAGCVKRLIAGRFFTDPAERAVVVSEFLLYRLGLQDDAAADRVVGKKLRLEFRAAPPQTGFGLHLIKPEGGETTRLETVAIDKVRSQLPTALDRFDLTVEEKVLLRKATQAKPVSLVDTLKEEFTIIGVIRLPTSEESKERWDPLRAYGDVIVPLQTATDLFFRVPGEGERSLDHATVLVDREENVKDVLRRIHESGFEGHAAVEYIERERLMYLLIFGAMTCVAAVALLVAALGIANTMLMSVLERTREIGIMKAVGAGNLHLQLIFLIEGGLIGLAGGGLGLALGWGASFPADSWVRSMVSRDLKIELDEPIFVFPFWLTLTVLAFAVIVTILAAVAPARRAARVDPVAALRHE
jgi:putative ABC transport system permease protein